MLIEDKIYIFKCGYKNGKYPCNGTHEFVSINSFDVVIKK